MQMGGYSGEDADKRREEHRAGFTSAKISRPPVLFQVDSPSQTRHTFLRRTAPVAAVDRDERQALLPPIVLTGILPQAGRTEPATLCAGR